AAILRAIIQTAVEEWKIDPPNPGEWQRYTASPGATARWASQIRGPKSQRLIAFSRIEALSGDNKSDAGYLGGIGVLFQFIRSLYKLRTEGLFPPQALMAFTPTSTDATNAFISSPATMGGIIKPEPFS